MILQSRAISIPRRHNSASRRIARARYTVSGIVLGGILVLTSFVDLLTRIKIGSISANGFFTVLFGALVLLLLLSRRNVPSRVMSAVRVGVVLVLWATSSVLWNANRSVESIQNICVLLLFVASIVLVGSQSANSRNATLTVIKQLPWAVCFSTVVFLTTIFHLYSVQSRLYALFASVGVMWFAAGWRFHEKGARIATIVIVFCIGVSLSRTALISCILVLPWVLSFRGKSLSGSLRPVLTLLILGILTLVAIFSFPALQRRFTEQGDQGVTVNGTNISTEGRAEIWAAVFREAMRSPIVGLGAGSATDQVTKQFGASIAQPHNDYLRIFHDYGLVGILLSVGFVISLFSTLRRQYRVAKSLGNITQQRHIIAAVSGLVMVLLSMTTDNIIIYPGPMFLEAVLLGNALGADLGEQSSPRRAVHSRAFAGVPARLRRFNPSHSRRFSRSGPN